MVGRDDERIERALLGVLESGPRDVLGVLAGLRKRLSDAFGKARSEGHVHAFLHRAVRAGRIQIVEPGPSGLPRYALASASIPKSSRPHPVDLGPVTPKATKIALRVARAVRDPADRGRVQADVLAHLAAEDGVTRFGSVKSAHNVLRRVDRGKRTILAAWSPGDFFKRVLLHDGPWIVGVVVVFFAVRGFVVEIFKIPTESMIPTLETDDRVAVWKRFGDPKRYAIMTFDRGDTTYVKRLIGLPGEEIALWRGDVFIDRKRLKKPDDVAAALRFPLAQWDFRADAGRAGPGPDWRRRVSHDEVSWIWNTAPLFPNGKDDVHAKRYGFRLRDGYLTVSGTAGAGGTLVAVLTREAYGGGGSGPQGRVVLEVGGEGITLTAFGRDAEGATRDPQELAHDAAPRHGAQEIELAYVDGDLRARVGDWRVRVPFEMPDAPLTFEVGARGVGRVASAGVDADIHYAQRAPEVVIAVPAPGDTDPATFGHKIPDDAVFFLGDNTTNSNDSRTRAMGDIPVRDLIGPVVFRIWPLHRIGTVR